MPGMNAGSVPLLIVGQGIGGTMFAAECIFRGLRPGKDFAVVDQGLDHSSSYGSTGLINPVVFKRMTLSWGADLVPQAWQSYSRLAKLLNSAGLTEEFIDQRPIRRFFKSNSERELWINSGRAFGDAGKPNTYQKKLGTGIGFGSAEIPHSGRIIASILLSQMKQYLLSNNALFSGTWEISEAARSPGKTASHKNQAYPEAETIVLCTGIQQRFSHPDKSMPDAGLKFYPVKGEVYQFYLPELNETGIISQGISLIPASGKDCYLAGSSYIRDFTSAECEGEGLSWLLSECRRNPLLKDIDLVSRIRSCWAGIRPASKDRLAYLGLLPDSSPGNMYYAFNGLGTRGFMLAPGLAAMLAEHIFNGTDIPTELDAGRAFN